MKKFGKTTAIVMLLALFICAASFFAACGKPQNGGGTGGEGGGTMVPEGKEPFVTSVVVTRQPYKTDYIVGEIFQPEGLTFDAHWDVDGEEVIIDMNYADCDGYTYYGEPLVLGVDKIEFTLEGFKFSVPVTVKEGEADLPVTYTQLSLHTDLGSATSTTVKENGILLTGEENDVIIDHTVYSGFTQFKVAGNLENNSKYRELVVKGGGLKGTKTAGTRTKVRYVFKNTGKNPLSFRLYYDDSGNIGPSKIMYLEAGETDISDFVVRTDKANDGSEPWFRVELLKNTSETTIAMAGYILGEIQSGVYDLTLSGAAFADGGTSKTLEAGDKLPETVSGLQGKIVGWYNELDLSEKWMGDTFTMPAHDVVLRPISTVTEGFQATSVKPRDDMQFFTVVNGKRVHVAETDTTSEGYSDSKMKVTMLKQYKDGDGNVYDLTAGTVVTAGCATHISDDNEYDRLFKVTVSRLSGELHFKYFIDFNYEKYLVKNNTMWESHIGEDNQTAVFYFIVPRGFKLSSDNHFAFNPTCDLTGDVEFTFECEYTRLA